MVPSHLIITAVGSQSGAYSTLIGWLLQLSVKQPSLHHSLLSFPLSINFHSIDNSSSHVNSGCATLPSRALLCSSSHSPCSTILDRDDKATSHCQIAHHPPNHGSTGRFWISHQPDTTNSNQSSTTWLHLVYHFSHQPHCWPCRTMWVIYALSQHGFLCVLA